MHYAASFHSKSHVISPSNVSSLVENGQCHGGGRTEDDNLIDLMASLGMTPASPSLDNKPTTCSRAEKLSPSKLLDPSTLSPAPFEDPDVFGLDKDVGLSLSEFLSRLTSSRHCQESSNDPDEDDGDDEQSYDSIEYYRRTGKLSTSKTTPIAERER
jgi:hypothetical protein